MVVVRSIQAAHGPEAVAYLSTGQIPTEEMAFLGALAKFGRGMKHGDGNTRQCMATALPTRSIAKKSPTSCGSTKRGFRATRGGPAIAFWKEFCAARAAVCGSFARIRPILGSISFKRVILDRLDFLVVQDMYQTTDTSKLADLVLPAAGWGEKEGTFINSERRIGVVKKVAKAPGVALSDFSIFQLVAKYWGCDEMFARWRTPEDVFETMKQLSSGQPCDITGIRDYRHLDSAGGIQWPYPADDADDAPQRRLFANGRFFHNDGMARLLFDPPRPLPEMTTEKFPLLLLTGRGSASQWHTQTRTSQSDVLRKLYPAQPYVEINPGDARNLQIRPGDLVRVVSQRGRVQAKAVLTPTIKAGQLFIPMHYVTANHLTFGAFDPHSSQPAYKACAVRIETGW